MRNKLQTQCYSMYMCVCVCVCGTKHGMVDSKAYLFLFSNWYARCTNKNTFVSIIITIHADPKKLQMYTEYRERMYILTIYIYCVKTRKYTTCL